MNILKKTAGAALMVLAIQASAQAADAKHGHELFLKNGCYLCHGTVAQGSNAGPHLVPGLIPFEALSAYVRRPANEMPPFSKKILSEAKLRDIYAYLESIPKPPSADSIALLPKIAGQ